MKVLTICGSMKFENQMREISSRLEAEQGICVLTPINYEKKHKDDIAELENIFACHMKKIELSDGIYVLNIDGYVGESTKSQISYAKRLGKEIIYHVPLEGKTKVSKKLKKVK